MDNVVSNPNRPPTVTPTRPVKSMPMWCLLLSNLVRQRSRITALYMLKLPMSWLMQLLNEANELSLARCASPLDLLVATGKNQRMCRWLIQNARLIT